MRRLRGENLWAPAAVGLLVACARPEPDPGENSYEDSITGGVESSVSTGGRGGGSSSSSGGSSSSSGGTTSSQGGGSQLGSGGVTTASGGGNGAGAQSSGSGGEPGGDSQIQMPYRYGDPITIEGRRLLIGGRPIHLKGVCWNPVPKGGEHPAGIDFAGLAPVDIPLMKAAGVNVVRTYEPLLDTDVLDQLAAAEIYLIQSVFPFGNDPGVVVERVEQTQDHPAILMWAIGNEWNYNGFYQDVPFEDAVSNIQSAVSLIAARDLKHPIATIYGELPEASLIEELDGIDIWGINAYRGLDFNGLIEDFAHLSERPFFLAEFGADAWDARGEGSYNPDAQAEATASLIGELLDNSVTAGPEGVVLGGTIFEWADEWWKAGDPSKQDLGGVAPGGGPYPDATFNEEWWGIVDVDRQTRPAYEVLKQLYAD